ncbi:transposase [Shewanella sp. FJAT-51649]|nr:transposase [Shewanella sp. FJAT-51649]
METIQLSLNQPRSITSWIGEEAIASWQTKSEQGKKSRPRFYSDLSITIAKTCSKQLVFLLRSRKNKLVIML